MNQKNYPGLFETFRDRCKTNPNQFINVSESISLTYEELDLVSQILSTILLKNANESENIIIYGARNPFLTAAIIGIVRAGLVFSIIDPSYPPSHILKRINYLKAKTIVNCGPAMSIDCSLTSSTSMIIQLEDIFTNISSHFLKDEHLETTFNNDLMYCTFTSGTCGIPKAVWGSYNPIAHFLEWQINTFEITNNDRVSVLSGLSHDPIFRDILLPLTTGACAIFPEDSHYSQPGKLFEWLSDKEISIIHATPSLIDLMLNVPQNMSEKKMDSLRLVFLGGEKLHVPTVKKIHAYAPNALVINCYGATETPQVMGYHVLSKKEIENGLTDIPIGKGIADVDLLILNDNHEECPSKTAGTIHIRTPYRAYKLEHLDKSPVKGYLANPLTNDSKDLLYCTGDVGEYDEQKIVHYKGRRDKQVKIRGYRVDLNEVDAVLMSVPNIKKAFSTYTHFNRTDMVCSYVIIGDNSSITQEDIKSKLTDQVPPYMVPGRVIIVNAFPLTPNGKIDADTLYRENVVNSDGVLSQTKSKILSILEEIGIDISLGLKVEIDSLKAIEFACKIDDEYGFKIDLSSISQLKSREDFLKFEKSLDGKTSFDEIKSTIHTKENYRIEKRSRLIPKNEKFYRGLLNRILQMVARIAPDVWRVKCHKWRGVKLGKNVSIGYDTIIETAYPFLVEIKDNTNIGMRCTFIAHFRGKNKSMLQPTIVIEEYAFVGPGVIILPNVTIGHGAVIAAGSVVNSNIPPMSFAIGNPAKTIAKCTFPLSGKTTYDEFMSGLIPLTSKENPFKSGMPI